MFTAPLTRASATRDFNRCGIIKFNGDYFSDPGENLSSRREISDRLFFHRCSTAVPPLRRGICCGTNSGTHGIHFLWVLFYDTACVMLFPPYGGHGPAGGRGRQGRLCLIVPGVMRKRETGGSGFVLGFVLPSFFCFMKSTDVVY